MKARLLSMKELTLIAGTRVALGAGLGLVLGGRLGGSARKGAGWALLAVGAITTAPLLAIVLNRGVEVVQPRRGSVLNTL